MHSAQFRTVTDWNRSLRRTSKKLSDKVRAASEKRNRYVHDSWTVLSETRGERLQVTARKKLFLGYVTVETTEVETFAEEVQALTAELDYLGIRIFDATRAEHVRSSARYGR